MPLWQLDRADGSVHQGHRRGAVRSWGLYGSAWMVAVDPAQLHVWRLPLRLRDTAPSKAVKRSAHHRYYQSRILHRLRENFQ